MSADDALLERITALAPDASVDDLVKLADAYQKVAYGPTGGAFDYDYSYTATTTARTTQRYEGDARRPAGFDR